MRIELNGTPREIDAGNVAEALRACGYGSDRVATALNGVFVPFAARADTALSPGDRLEVLVAMQGG